VSPEINHIDAAIADLEGWIERIATAVETLKMFRSGGGALPSASSGVNARSAPGGEIQHDTFFQMSIPDAAEKYLTLAKKTRPTSDVAASLLKGGLKSSAKNFTSMVNTILTRESRFVRVNGEWGLDAWYPGMRKSAGRKRSGGETTITEPQAEAADKPKRNLFGEAVSSHGFTSDSLRGRTLILLNSEPNTTFNAPAIAQRLNSDNVGSVSAALSALFAENLIARPGKGRYQSK
jgi:hypothetical protein